MKYRVRHPLDIKWWEKVVCLVMNIHAPELRIDTITRTERYSTYTCECRHFRKRVPFRAPRPDRPVKP